MLMLRTRGLQGRASRRPPRRSEALLADPATLDRLVGVA
jgi:hypothetical protein